VDERGWQMTAWCIAAIVAVVFGVRALSGRGDAPPAPVRIDGAPRAGHPAPRPARPSLYVHVTGEVRRPGLYRVADARRVAAAIERAGGPTRSADLGGVNLAARLEDGQQIVVPSRGASGLAAGGETAQAPVSLGSATVEQLDRLDGIGPTLAERIVEHRQSRGGFSSLDQLAEVEGIGAKRLAALKEALTP
jgi:competence protein ComEA